MEKKEEEIMRILEGGNWHERTYAGSLGFSMNHREEIPNIVVLASPYGALKSIVETSIATRDAIQKGEIIPTRCWNPHAIA